MLFKSAWIIAKKDLYTEWKTKQTIATMMIFAGLVILVFSFAFDPMNAAVKALIPGLIWVITIFAGLLGLNRSFLSESSNDTMQAMIIAPVDPTSIYLGKLFSNFIMLLFVELVSLPVLFILFNYEIPGRSYPWLLLALFVGTFGFCAIGTFLAAITANSKSSEMMLPIILFPIASPAIIGSVQATKIALTNFEQLQSAVSWLQLMTAYDLIIFVACFLLFEYIQEV